MIRQRILWTWPPKNWIEIYPAEDGGVGAVAMHTFSDAPGNFKRKLTSLPEITRVVGKGYDS